MPSPLFRTCSWSSQQDSQESQSYHLQTGTQLTLAVFPKPPVLFQPGKAALYYPPLRQYCKTVQFVSFGNLYLRTHQRLYRQSKGLTRVTTVSKDFLYRTKIIPVTFQCHQAAFSIRNIRRRYRKGMRQTLRVNRYMPLDTAHLLARIVAFFHGGIRVLHTLRINNQESGFFMAPLLAALRNYLIFLTLPQGC